MGNFNRGGFGGGRGGGRSFGNKRDFHDRGPRQMFKAVCSNCGKDCEVPFRPTGEKPVYCRDCFREMNPEQPRRDDRNFSRPSFDNNRPAGNTNEYKDQLAALSVKVDKILSILESAVTPKETAAEETEQPKAPEKKKRSPKKTS